MAWSLGMLFLIGVVIGWIVTRSARFAALRAGIVDWPNPRSSHEEPTPTLGGLGIILGVWLALCLGYSVLSLHPLRGWEVLLGSTLVLMLLGYDEVRPMGRLAKLAVQVGASLLLVASGAVLHRVSFPGLGEVVLGELAFPVTLIWFVAVQNLYNFMDGIDGIAGVEGCLVAILIGGLSIKFIPNLAPLSWALAGVTLGFLFWNFPPAKIFMGDVGGHFLGLIFGLMAVIGEDAGVPFVVILLFMGGFLFDSVYTILRRLFLREDITQAHRYHLYQRLNALGWAQARVSVVYGGFTLLFGAVGYLWFYGHFSQALWMGCFLTTLIVSGTLWLEYEWRRKSVSRIS